jgi:hypothetical protein
MPRRVRRASALAVLTLLLLPGGTGSAQQASGPPSASSPLWGELVLPGGAQELLVSAGIAASIEEWRAVPAVIELFYGGLNPRIPRTFRSYGSRTGQGADSTAPLPLGMDFWVRALDVRVPPERLLPTILASRATASLYYGLLCLDTATLSAVQTDPALASTLIRHAERLPVHAKAVRIRGGHMDPPGGDDLAPLWIDLVGRLDRPAEFVETLLTRDDGRLGHFYNTIDALPARTIRFLAGPAEMTSEDRLKRLRDLYDVFSRSMTTWDGPERRFFPMRGGPAPALFTISIDSDGSVTGPVWLDFWDRAFSDSRSAAGIDFERMVDGASLLKLLCPGAHCDEEKIHTAAFIQRQPDARSPEKLGALLAAARTRLRYPALALVLEQLRLDDVTIYAAAARVAERIDDLPRNRRGAALAQFQGAISLLRRLRTVGMPPELVRRHLDALVALPISRDGYRGGALRWFVVDVLDAEQGEMDAAAVRLLAGTAPPGPNLEWEGLRYRVNIAATEAERIRSARARFEGHALASAWALLKKGDRAADAASADAFVALVYSVTLQDGATPLALSRELPRRHDVFGRVPGDPLPPAWTLPSIRLADGGVRHIGGSVLALESGVPELASRRLSADRPRDRARISPVLADGLLRTAALTSLWTDASDEGAKIESAAARGASLARDPAALEGALASAGIAGPRAGWIRWAIARGQPEPSSVLRLEDFVRLGDPDLALPNTGAAAVPLSCLCVEFPSISWEMRGQPPDHFVAAALSVEAPLRVATELRARHLPSVLAPGVLSLVASDLVEASSLAHPADFHGIADTVRRMSRTRFDDYIAAVAARGPLVPVSSGGTADR